MQARACVGGGRLAADGRGLHGERLLGLAQVAQVPDAHAACITTRVVVRSQAGGAVVRQAPTRGGDFLLTSEVLEYTVSQQD